MTRLGILGALLLAAACSALLGACARSPEAQVFAVQSGYTAAMVPAADYVEQPVCGTPGALAPPFCADPAVKQEIKDVVAVAGPAVRGAQNAVRSGNATLASALLVTARAAIAALIAATPKEPSQ